MAANHDLALIYEMEDLSREAQHVDSWENKFWRRRPCSMAPPEFGHP